MFDFKPNTEKTYKFVNTQDCLFTNYQGAYMSIKMYICPLWMGSVEI